LSDFFDFDLAESVVVSVEVSVVGAFSVLLSVFFDSEVVFFFVEGLVALSAAGLLVLAGLFVVVDDLVEGDAVIAGAAVGDGLVLTLALAAGVIVAATEAVAAGVMVTPALAAGVALAFVEAVTPVVVLVVGAVFVVPVVEVTPTLKLGVTP
jgi:hypothetical protein